MLIADEEKMGKFGSLRTIVLAVVLTFVICFEETAHGQTILWTVQPSAFGVLAVAPTSGQLVYAPVPTHGNAVGANLLHQVWDEGNERGHGL